MVGAFSPLEHWRKTEKHRNHVYGVAQVAVYYKIMQFNSLIMVLIEKPQNTNFFLQFNPNSRNNSDFHVLLWGLTPLFLIKENKRTK